MSDESTEKQTSPEKSATPKQASDKRLQLSDLKPAQGARKYALRVGRGRASGAGKTCNRGHNGEGQRSGRSRKRGFEGGQMPLYRRLPHIRGFEVFNRKTWVELTVQDLKRFIQPGGDQITLESLQAQGIYKPHRHDGVRILGTGELSQKISVEAHYFTPSAKQKIEAAGGQAQLAECAAQKSA